MEKITGLIQYTQRHTPEHTAHVHKLTYWQQLSTKTLHLRTCTKGTHAHKPHTHTHTQANLLAPVLDEVFPVDSGA